MRASLHRLFLLLALSAGGAGHAASGSDPLAEGAFIDHAWSGHPVGFALLVEQGHVFVGYYDAERRLTIASRAAGAQEWTKVQPAGVWNAARKRLSTVVGWDSHNSIVMAVDRDGHLHLSANLHVDPLVYYRTTRPLDITSFERLDRMTGEREARCTYPHFFENPAGDLFFSYRDGSSGDAVDLYNIYDRTTRTWRRHLPTPLHDGEGTRSAYSLKPTLGPDGRFHLLWMWRDTPDAATNQQLAYARSRDLLHWEDARGQAIELPITFGAGDIVDDAKPGEGLINTTYVLGFDREQRPVAFYHRYDAAGHSQIFAARPGEEAWDRRALTDWNFRWSFGGQGSLQVDVYLLPVRSDWDGSLLVPFTARSMNDGVLRVDPDTLTTLAVLSPDPPVLPPEQMKPRSTFAGMEVRTRVVTDEEVTHVLRWETLPSNRDRPRAEAPPPSELRMIERRRTARAADRPAARQRGPLRPDSPANGAVLQLSLRRRAMNRFNKGSTA